MCIDHSDVIELIDIPTLYVGLFACFYGPSAFLLAWLAQSHDIFVIKLIFHGTK